MAPLQPDQNDPTLIPEQQANDALFDMKRMMSNLQLMSYPGQRGKETLEDRSLACSFVNLPTEIIDHIFSYLRPDDSLGVRELKVLVLCRKTHSSAERALYRFVRIVGSKDLENVKGFLAKLDDKPVLARNIEVLDLCTKNYMGSYIVPPWDDVVSSILSRCANLRSVSVEMRPNMKETEQALNQLSNLKTVKFKSKDTNCILGSFPSSPVLGRLMLDGVAIPDCPIPSTITELDILSLQLGWPGVVFNTQTYKFASKLKAFKNLKKLRLLCDNGIIRGNERLHFAASALAQNLPNLTELEILRRPDIPQYWGLWQTLQSSLPLLNKLQRLSVCARSFTDDSLDPANNLPESLTQLELWFDNRYSPTDPLMATTIRNHCEFGTWSHLRMISLRVPLDEAPWPCICAETINDMNQWRTSSQKMKGYNAFLDKTGIILDLEDVCRIARKQVDGRPLWQEPMWQLRWGKPIHIPRSVEWLEDKSRTLIHRGRKGKFQ